MIYSEETDILSFELACKILDELNDVNDALGSALAYITLLNGVTDDYVDEGQPLQQRISARILDTTELKRKLLDISDPAIRIHVEQRRLAHEVFDNDIPF